MKVFGIPSYCEQLEEDGDGEGVLRSWLKGEDSTVYGKMKLEMCVGGVEQRQEKRLAHKIY